MYGEREINGMRIYNNDTIGLGTSMAIGNTSRTTREEHVVRWEEDMRRARGFRNRAKCACSELLLVVAGCPSELPTHVGLRFSASSASAPLIPE